MRDACARRILKGETPRRPAGHTSHETRVDHQSQDRQDTRSGSASTNASGSRHDQSLEAFVKRVEGEAEAFPPHEWDLTRDTSFSHVNGVSGLREAPPHALSVLHRNMDTIMLPKQFSTNMLSFNKNIVISGSQN